MYSRSEPYNWVGCGLMLLFLVFNALVGGWSINYCIAWFGGNTLPLLIAGIIGLFLAEVSVPLALILMLIGMAS